ncbi:MAG: hypothetical protein K6G50_09605 [bacterium]|nr:hypothetical protein [bacterium]
MSDFSKLAPFPTNPEIMSRIRPITRQDCHCVAKLHYDEIKSSFWSKLGFYFIENLYGMLINNPYFCGYVYEEEGCVKGFIAGSTDTKKLFSETIKKHFLKLVWITLISILKRPNTLSRVITTPVYFALSKPQFEDIKAESIFCAFKPELRGKRISGYVNKVLFDRFFELGFDYVKVTTEITNPGSNRQLLSWGFDEVSNFKFYNKDMRIYVLKLINHPRIDQSLRKSPPGAE